MTYRARSLALAAALVGSLAAPAALAQDRYIGEIMLVGYNFCPRGTASAEGQLLSIASNSALFSLFGTTFGGDGRTTFALPDLRGRAPIGQGTGPGLAGKNLGQSSGAETAALTVANMPPHSHTAAMSGTSANGNTDNPAGAVPAARPRTNIYSNSGGSDAAMATQIAIGTSGGGAPFNVRDPYLAMRYCVVLFGIFPSRD